MTARLIIGDVRVVLATLEPASVDLVLSSPPFLAVRSYLPDGHPDKALEIGSEATPAAYLDTLLDVVEACARVLAPHGSLAFELGDTYAGSGGAGGDYDEATGLRAGQPIYKGSNARKEHRVTLADGRTIQSAGISNGQARKGNGWPLDKSLCGIPQAFMLSLSYGCNILNPERTTPPWRVRTLKPWIRCLDIDTNVYVRTPTGDRPMRMLHLHQQFQPGRFKLWTGEKWTEVTETVASTADDGIEVEFRTGERIACTRGHRWPVETILGETKLLRTDELTVGDVVRQVQLPDPDRGQPSGLPDDDIGWFVGVFLGDGSFDSKGRIQISGHQVLDAKRGERLARIAADYDGTSSVYEHGDNLAGSVVVRSRPLAAVVKHYIGGDGARNKHLTPAAWRRSNGFLRSLLMGYLESDGHYDEPNDRWRLGFTDNPWLARDLRTVCARLGAACIVRRWRAGKDERGGQWAGSSTFKHRGEIRFAHKQHWAKPRGEVVAIRETKRRSFIDVAVADEPHLFALASGLLTHNTNPPVGALGDKERPATSYVIVATKARDRWFDLDGVRVSDRTSEHDEKPHIKAATTAETGVRGFGANVTYHARGGAPPLDWWCHVDAVLDAALQERKGKPVSNRRTAKGVDSQARTGKSADRGGNWRALPEQNTPTSSPTEPPAPNLWDHVDAVLDQELARRAALRPNGPQGAQTPNPKALAGPDDARTLPEMGHNRNSGATGAHLRRALQTAGILHLEEAIDQSPGGYSGAHYAVWPPELCALLIKEMCPREVCRECGEPRRRITQDDPGYDAVKDSGFGVEDDPRRNGKRGDHAAPAAMRSQGRGGLTRQFSTLGWSDCGHDNYRPGVVLDPFVGSGTTMATATGHGRDAIGIDLDARNVDLIRARCGMFFEVDG